MNIHQWAIKHQVSAAALQELNAMFGIDYGIPYTPSDVHTEAYVQSLVRIEAAQKGVRLWRNNVGVLPNEMGQPVRYGLANDSQKLNKVVKSGDLIGWRPVTIAPEMIGHRIAQFVSRECKKPSWKYSGNEHETAQLRWAQALNADGGDACFVTSRGTL
jgi:ribosomal protein S19